MSSDPILSASYQAAEQVMKAHSKSFYQAFSAIPPHRFQGVAAVYAFCRYGQRTDFNHPSRIRPCGGCH